MMYLKEEIRAEALVRNFPGFLRFLPIAALFHGQVVNVSGVALDSGTPRTTVGGYLVILEDTLLTFRLPAYEAKLRLRERKHPKLYWIDPGLVRAVKKQFGRVAAEERGSTRRMGFDSLRAHGEECELYDASSTGRQRKRRTSKSISCSNGDDGSSPSKSSRKRDTRRPCFPACEPSVTFPSSRGILLHGGTRSLKTSTASRYGRSNGSWTPWKPTISGLDTDPRCEPARPSIC